MTIYELKNEKCIIQFETYEELKQYQETLENSNDWEVGKIEVKELQQEEETPTFDYFELLEKNQNFGKNLIKTFLLDNYKLPKKISEESSLELMKKFKCIINFCQLGDVKSVLFLLEKIEIDEIFTDERKNIYLENIRNYLESVKR